MFRHFPFKLGSILLLVMYLVQCQSKPTGIKPIYKELTEAVYASGNLMPKNEYKVFALAEGYLSRKMVEEGNMVEANQILFLVESTQQDARSRNAQDVYRQAAQNLQPNSPILAELEVAIQNAEIKMKNDSVNFFRQQKLKAANATTGFEFDKASLAYQVSKNEYLQQKSRYDKTKNQLYLEMRNAESQFQIQNQESGNYALKSKIKGIVYEIYKEEGESVRRNEAIALLGAEEEVYLKLAVDELDIDKIKLGQEILVKVDV
ncbi:MAG TPA: RND transporter, partial [Microscillaceae bacterium]|nr:RND transporter [Microscillaceae bacterium]